LRIRLPIAVIVHRVVTRRISERPFSDSWIHLRVAIVTVQNIPPAPIIAPPIKIGAIRIAEDSISVSVVVYARTVPVLTIGVPIAVIIHPVVAILLYPGMHVGLAIVTVPFIIGAVLAPGVAVAVAVVVDAFAAGAIVRIRAPIAVIVQSVGTRGIPKGPFSDPWIHVRIGIVTVPLWIGAVLAAGISISVVVVVDAFAAAAVSRVYGPVAVIVQGVGTRGISERTISLPGIHLRIRVSAILLRVGAVCTGRVSISVTVVVDACAGAQDPEQDRLTPTDNIAGGHRDHILACRQLYPGIEVAIGVTVVVSPDEKAVNVQVVIIVGVGHDVHSGIDVQGETPANENRLILLGVLAPDKRRLAFRHRPWGAETLRRGDDVVPSRVIESRILPIRLLLIGVPRRAVRDDQVCAHLGPGWP
jgi:hypothetical protein